jgi:phenylacetate-CoA oxygenase PaaH subunit
VRIYEVFLRKEGKESFHHAGAFEAADDDLARLLVRETYLRRGEGDEAWLVDRRHVVSVNPEFIAPNLDRPHRRNDGRLVSEHRRGAAPADEERS